jgi:Icc-related predicted phosphoesterase
MVGNQMMLRVLPISDIHNEWGIFDDIIENYVGTFDLLLIAGDIFGHRITYPQNFIDLMEDTQRKIDVPIVMIQGNHDWWDWTMFDDSKDITVLHNTTIDIMGLKIFGTPYTPPFLDWNFMSDDTPERLGEIFTGMIPDNCDVVLSHGPPYGYGDTCRNGGWGNAPDFHMGSKEFTKGIKLHKPRYVFCGHIHTGIRYSEIENGNEITKVFNVSCLDEDYDYNKGNPRPEVVEIELV